MLPRKLARDLKAKPRSLDLILGALRGHKRFSSREGTASMCGLGRCSLLATVHKMTWRFCKDKDQ